VTEKKLQPSRQFGCLLLHSLALGFLLGLFEGSVLAGAPSAGADRFYDTESVQTVHLEVAAEDLAKMQHALPKRIYAPATFRWNDQVVESVGLRYKGDSSSMPESPFKRSFLIKFGEFKTGQRFLGLRHVALDNGIQFGSLFSERLITDALRGLGVTVSRCNYAKVYLNGKCLGVFVNVERVDESFLKHYFGNEGGMLFKVDQGGPGADFRYVGNDPALYEKTFELHVGKRARSYQSLVEFLQAINSDAGDSAGLSRILDIEPFVKTTAVLLFAGAFDQYTGWNPHNYYLYRNSADQRWTYIPWDLDVGFADKAFGRIPVLEGWHAAWPVPVDGRPLMERIVSDPVLLRHYREQAAVILETWFKPEVLIPKLRGLYALIRSALQEDPYPPRRATVPDDTGFPDIVASMETFIRQRYALARRQLDNPGARPRPRPMAPSPDQEGPKPGPPSQNAPTDLRVVKVTASKVELQWTDHAEGEMAFIVQRCTGADSTNFTNAIGQPGQDITTATDNAVQPGMTYRYRVYTVVPTPRGPQGSGVSNVVTVAVPKN